MIKHTFLLGQGKGKLHIQTLKVTELEINILLDLPFLLIKNSGKKTNKQHTNNKTSANTENMAMRNTSFVP